MKCLAIGGEPATGKTTLVKYMYPNFRTNFEFGLLKGHLDEKTSTSLLGLYHTDNTFCGTDRLSMGVNPDFLKFVDDCKDRRNIVFEGDRLFTKNNLLYLQRYYELKIVILKSTPDTLAKRHIDRKDNQSPTFIKGRQTKVKNIESHFKDIVDVYFPVNLQESEKLGKTLYKWVTK